jgi:hypothetical protein
MAGALRAQKHLDYSSSALRNLSSDDHICAPLQRCGVAKIVYDNLFFNRVGFTPFTAATRET